MSHSRKIALASLALTVMVAAPLSFAEGRCASARLEETLILPDGSEHPAGVLTLCATREYSPVATLHETYVDGMAISMLLSRRGTSEGVPDGPFMMFTRDLEGRLHLYGYAVPSSGRQVTYLLGRQPGDKRAPAPVIALEKKRKDSEPGTVLLAANVR